MNEIPDLTNTDVSQLTLADIQRRKKKLKTEIQKDSTKIEQYWRSLYQSPKQLKNTSNFANLVNIGGGAFDIILLRMEAL